MATITFDTKQVPDYVRSTAQILLDAEFDAYLVGGAVRDLLVNKHVKDFDIATNATPKEVQALFSKAILTGERFGNTIVIAESESGERFDVDVTTFRKEENYFGGRWPGKVEFASAIQEDLSRRDLTINALAINLSIIINDEDQILEIEDIVDPFNGIADIVSGTIRAVRDPFERMKEDGLRAFRACRLACELGFTIENNTQEAIKQNLHIAEKISMERIRDEINKMLKHAVRPSTGFVLMNELGLLVQIMPELIATKSITQPEWHDDDVFTHSLKAMDLSEDSIKLAALFHDIGKATTMTKDNKGTHFYGHDVEGERITKDIMKRLRYSNREIDRVSNLVRWHMFYYPSADWRKSNTIDTVQSEKGKTVHGWTDAAIRRFIRNIGGMDTVDDLIKLRIADASSNSKTEFNPIEIEVLQKRIANVLAQDMALKTSDLDITGHDLQDLGLTAGPKYSQIFEFLLEHVLDDPSLNLKETLVSLVKDNFINNKTQ